MKIHLGSHLPATCSANQILQSPQKIDHNSTIAQCADTVHQTSGCCLTQLLDKIIECFNALLVYLGLKEKKIGQLLKDPIAFLKLLHPTVNIADDMVPSINSTNMFGESIFFLLCKNEGETIDLPSGEKLIIDHEIIRYVLEYKNPSIEPVITRYGQYSPLFEARSDATMNLLLDQAPNYLHIRDSQECGLLHRAAEQGKTAIVKCLIARDSGFVWERDQYYRTPLYVASTVEIAQLILAVDSDLLIAQDGASQSPTQFANSSELQAFLQQQSQNYNPTQSKVDLQTAMTLAVSATKFFQDQWPKMAKDKESIIRYLDIAKARIAAGKDYRTVDFDDGEDAIAKAKRFSDVPGWKELLDFLERK